MISKVNRKEKTLGFFCAQAKVSQAFLYAEAGKPDCGLYLAIRTFRRPMAEFCRSSARHICFAIRAMT